MSEADMWKVYNIIRKNLGMLASKIPTRLAAEEIARMYERRESEKNTGRGVRGSVRTGKVREGQPRDDIRGPEAARVSDGEG